MRSRKPDPRSAPCHFLSFEIGQILLYRIEQRDLTLIHKHHDSGAGNRLRKRCDAKDGIGQHGGFGFDLPKPDGVECGNVSMASHGRHDSGRFAGVGKLFHANRDVRKPDRIHPRGGRVRAFGGEQTRTYAEPGKNGFQTSFAMRHMWTDSIVDLELKLLLPKT